MENFKVKTEPEINVTQEDVDDIVATALEGGINYWCRKAEVVGDYLGEYASEQISRGGTLKLYDSEEDEVYELTRDKRLMESRSIARMQKDHMTSCMKG